MSTSALYTAIKTRAEADATLSALGTLYVNELPPNTTFPCYRLISGENKVDQAFGVRYTENCGLQFSIFTTTLATAESYQDALHTRFDNVALTLSVGTNLAFRRISDMILPTPGLTDKAGLPIFHAVSRYTAMVDRTF